MRSAARRRAATTVPVAASMAVAALVALTASPAVAADRPALASAQTATATATATAASNACTITDATVTWGFKESFRSYISGSIAKGAWEPFGGVSYATPVFTWTGGTGEFDPATGAGTLSFGGGIRFTGHNGLLDSTVQNATLTMSGGSGQVLLDLSGVSMDSALAGDDTVQTHTQVPLVTLDLAGMTVDRSGETLTLSATDAATAITAEGFEAFGNYEAGTAFDPLTFTATGECAAETPEPTPEPTEPAADEAAVTNTSNSADSSDDASPAALVAVIVSSVGAALAATVAGIFAVRAARRRKQRDESAEREATDSAAGDGSST